MNFTHASHAQAAPAGSDTQRAAAARPGALRRLAQQRWFIAVRAFGVFTALWYAAYLWNANPLQLPSPVAVASALWNLAAGGELLQHAGISSARLLIALAISIALAVPLGFWMGLSPTAEAYVDPVVELLRPISGIAWLPLALFIFGIGDTLPVFIMVYVGFFPILLNTISGVRQVDRKLIAAASTMGVGRAALLRYVIVPGALPIVMVGIRLALAASWAAIVAAELIGAPSGLGFAIEWYRELLMTSKVFAFIAVIGVVGYLCDVALRALQRRLTPWSEGTELA
ncbi:ABC transporter permease [Ramlibacter ginsenosidimutans]|uniref:ABC transporter permease n=1 Tax=Ramlibacter ginsenosidimutans TaxID=502333 RepID=A0A934TU79_9BURK|nr:ABC transporter permease [Ramlibacter ginsenosidimutans]MBK6006862.1 ABC transporter permease [Ramlibacter ginsenosidimutans]